MRKTALFKTPSIKNNERKEKKKNLLQDNLCYSVHVVENFYWSLWSLNSPTLLQQIEKTNKAKQETKIKLNVHTTNMALVKNFVNFVITNFLFLQLCSHL